MPKKITLFVLVLILLLTKVGCTVKPSLDTAGMVLINAGLFTMGSSQSNFNDEKPAHLVDLPAFWIDKLEVTNQDYQQCVEAGACEEPKDLRFYADPAYKDHPVVFITWSNAQEYCTWQGERLPTEAEWEKAARGPFGRIFPWGDELLLDHLNAGRREGTTLVGSYPSGASPYGVLDMAGNVWEWVDDWYQPYPGSQYQDAFFDQKYKVVRGGSWNHPPEDAYTFHRDFAHPERSMAVVGFRCAASAP